MLGLVGKTNLRADDTARQQILQTGAKEVIVTTLKHHSHDGELQWRAIQLLQMLDEASARLVENRQIKRAMSRQHLATQAQDTPNRVAKAASDGVVAVLELARTDMQDEELVAWCLDALGGLTAGDEKSRNAFVKDKGLDVVKAAYEAHPATEDVLFNANTVIATIATDEGT